MHVALRIAQYFGFFSTEISNFLLLYLISTKASTRFGSYKYLMISYAVFSIIYALVEISTQPIVHVSGAAMYLYVDSFLKFDKNISNPLASAYCASFGLCVSLLATHFVYRYFAVCRPHDLHHFNGLNLVKIYIIPTVCSIIWYSVYVLFLGPTDVKNQYAREDILDIYQDDISKVGYIAFLYFYPDKNGTMITNYHDFAILCIPCSIMQFCIITMAYCGLKTFQTMRNIKKSMSKKTKELNNQLFKTLVLQTLVPMCTMFIPVGTLLIIPMFMVKVLPMISNTSSFYACLYPALDTMIVIFMIRDFRDTVLCRKRIYPSLITNNISTLSAKHTSTTSGVMSGPSL